MEGANTSADRLCHARFSLLIGRVSESRLCGKCDPRPNLLAIEQLDYDPAMMGFCIRLNH
jgi:hypothetical protein